MMATVPHITSGLGLRKFQADGFLLTQVYQVNKDQPVACLAICQYIVGTRIWFCTMIKV